MTKRAMQTPLRSLPVAMALALGLSAAARSDAQERPGIPEIACTRIHVMAVPGTGAHAREIGVRIANDDPADFPAHLHAAIGVETSVGGTWRSVSTAGLLIRADCRTEPPSCVTLAPGATVNTVPWTGMLGDAQCMCSRCAPAPAGQYRFVVRTCANCFRPLEAVSAPFTLPPP